MARADLERTAESVVGAFNDTDLARFEELFVDGVVYEELTTPFEVAGRDGVVRRFRQLKSITPPQLRARVEGWVVDDERRVALSPLTWVFRERAVATGFLELTFDDAVRVVRAQNWLYHCGSVEIPPVA